MNNKIITLDPYWTTGFIDAEGSFIISIIMDKKYKTGWRIIPSFEVQLHVKDKELIENLRSFFNCGSIYSKNSFARLTIRDLKAINDIIIPHFEKFPLITQKHADFLIWKMIIGIINNKEHRTKEGLLKIIHLKTSLNKGLTEELKKFFPDIVKLEKVNINLPNTINNNWFSGFFSGEGSFFINIRKSKVSKTGYYVQLRLELTQNIRDEPLFKNFVTAFNSGHTYYSSDTTIRYSISKFSDIYDKWIPFFFKYLIIGNKQLDFKDFCEAAELINQKTHLKEGVKKLVVIKSKMNKSR